MDFELLCIICRAMATVTAAMILLTMVQPSRRICYGDPMQPCGMPFNTTVVPGE